MGDQIVIDSDDLQDVYSTLADATEAAARGDTNECASKAKDAKEQVLDIHGNSKALEVVTDG